MTNSIAVFLALTICALFAADYALYDWANTVFLMRKFTALLDWVAFWR